MGILHRTVIVVRYGMLFVWCFIGEAFADVVPSLYADGPEQLAYLTSKMRTLTVTVDVDKSRIDTLAPGNGLRFLEKYEVRRRNGEVMEVSTIFISIDAIFLSAKQLSTSRFEVSFLVKPGKAEQILRAEVQDRLTLNRDETKAAHFPKRCFARRGANYRNDTIEIPCG